MGVGGLSGGPGKGPEKSGGVRNKGGRRSEPEADGQGSCWECRGLSAWVWGKATPLSVLPGPRGSQRGVAGLRKHPGGLAHAASLPALSAPPSSC